VRFAVVGHIEWVQFARVEHVPRAGEVAHAHDVFEEPAGGGAVAAVQLARLAGGATLFTALGDDDHGRRSIARLRELGVDVRAQILSDGAETRRAVTLVDDRGERTITTFGPRLEPRGRAEGWAELSGCDGVYFTAGDEAALRLAREHARVLVASPRARHALGQGVPLEALVLSDEDEIERAAAERAREEAGLLVLTEGERGGRYVERDGAGEGRWQAVAPPGEVLDTYGCGDSFAAALTYGLAAGMPRAQAFALAARCGAACLTGRGPYGADLTGCAP
jgi:ribokinase